MIAVLIVLTYIGGLHTDGATVEMQEFSSIDVRESQEGADRQRQ